MNYPIEYKTIPTQYAFLISDDGTLQITQVTDTPKQIKFNSVKEAREYIKDYKEQL